MRREAVQDERNRGSGGGAGGGANNSGGGGAQVSQTNNYEIKLVFSIFNLNLYTSRYLNNIHFRSQQMQQKLKLTTKQELETV